MTTASQHTEIITLAGGCFWCTEAIFQRLKGVTSVTSGYTGGTFANPTYEQVSSGTTNHAEAIQITFDPTIISLQDILHVFWATHDPTTLNRQGNDVGTQYRSAIFYHTEQQKNIAEQSKKEQEASGTHNAPIVTEITPFSEFYPAEEQHRDFYNQNRSNRYCQLVIDPKIEKLSQKFSEKIA